MSELQKVGLEGTYLNTIKATYGKLMAPLSQTESGGKLKAFPLRSGIRQRCPLSPLLFNIVLEVLETVIREEKRNPSWKRRSKTALFVDDLMLYYTQKTPQTPKTLPDNCWSSSVNLVELLGTKL